MIRQPNPFDYGQIVFLAAIWGSAFLAIKVAVPEFGPIGLVATRVLLGFAVLLPFVLFRGVVLPTSARQWVLLFVIAVLNVVAPFFLISWAQLSINASVAALLMGTGPLLGLIASHLTTDDDKLNRWKLLAVFLGFSGVVIVVGRDATQGLSGNLMAQGAAMLGNACYVASGILIRKVDGLPPTRMAAIVLGMASLMLLAILPFAGFPDLSAISTDALLCVIYLGLIPTGLGYILRYRLIREVGFSTFALGINLIPVFGVGLSAWLLDEPLEITLVLALGLIVLALWVARRGVAINLQDLKKD